MANQPQRSLRLTPKNSFAGFTGNRGELFYDGALNTLRICDSTTQGGSVLATRTWTESLVSNSIQTAVNNISTIGNIYGTDSSLIIDIDTRRISVDRLNTDRLTVTGLSITAPLTAQGSPGDQQGQVIFTQQYLYYCHANYDATTAIWSRVALDDSDWA